MSRAKELFPNYMNALRSFKLPFVFPEGYKAGVRSVRDLHKFSVPYPILPEEGHMSEITGLPMPYDCLYIEVTSLKMPMGYTIQRTRSGLKGIAFSILSEPWGFMYAEYDAELRDGVLGFMIYPKTMSFDEHDAEVVRWSILNLLKFFACQNVHYGTTETLQLPKLSRPSSRRQKDWEFKYHVLKLKLGTKKHPRDVNINEPGFKMPLHSRRGHVKTYTADKPLFGKLVGSWYWHPSLVGDMEVGVVDKDYAYEAGS